MTKGSQLTSCSETYRAQPKALLKNSASGIQNGPLQMLGFGLARLSDAVGMGKVNIYRHVLWAQEARREIDLAHSIAAATRGHI